nr:MAG TPA: hypothetical protein [Caudoviricetes sp.]
MNCKNIGAHPPGCVLTILWSRALLRGGGAHLYIIYRCLHTPMQACTHPYVVGRYAYAPPTHRSGHTCTAREEVKNEIWK